MTVSALRRQQSPPKIDLNKLPDGYSSSQIKSLQKSLNLDQTGKVDNNLRSAVRSYQQQQHSKDKSFLVDGIVGKQTWGALKKGTPAANHAAATAGSATAAPAKAAAAKASPATAAQHTDGAAASDSAARAAAERNKDSFSGGANAGTHSATASATAAPATVDAKKDVHLNVPWYDQTKGGHGFTPGTSSCLLASNAMAQSAGARPLNGGVGVAVAKSKDSSGHITVDGNKGREGQAYIDKQLDAGKPVVVGVSHSGQRISGNDGGRGVSDHYVTITGRGVDAQGRQYYTFNDPVAIGRSDLGKDTRPENRFYVDQKSGMLYRPKPSPPSSISNSFASSYINARYEVSMVRANAN